MARIRLSRGQFAVIDDEDLPRTFGYKWSFKPSRETLQYAISNIKKDGKWGQQSLHRLIMNPPPDKAVIFLNHNGLDCRRRNMRVVDAVDARRHHRVRRDSLSGLKGIRQCPETGEYAVILSPFRSVRQLGKFGSLKAAKRAYDKLVGEFYGPYAPQHQPKREHASARRRPPRQVPRVQCNRGPGKKKKALFLNEARPTTPTKMTGQELAAILRDMRNKP